MTQRERIAEFLRRVDHAAVELRIFIDPGFPAENDIGCRLWCGMEFVIDGDRVSVIDPAEGTFLVENL